MLPSNGGFRRVLLLLVSIVLVWSFPSATAQHDGPLDDLDHVLFNDPHGVQMSDTLELNGTSSVPLRNASWSVVNLSAPTPTILLSGPYLTSVQPVSDTEFHWELQVDASDVDCTCLVQIVVEDSNGLERAWQLLVYLGTEGHRPVMLNEPPFQPSPTLEAVDDTDSHRFMLTSTRSVHQDVVLPSSSSAIIRVSATLCEAPNGVCLDEQREAQIPFSTTPSGINLTLDADALGLDQGIWKLHIEATDDLLRSTGQTTMTLLHDNHPPIVELTLDSVVNESETFHVHAVVDDGYIGSQVNLTWTIVDENGIRRGLLDGEQLAADHLVLNMSAQGTYSVEVSARDLAGQSTENNSSFTVLNLRPTAKISVDGLVVADGSVLSLSQEEDWAIDASDSQDNEAVEFLWVVNDDRSWRGSSVLSKAQFDGPGVYKVELIVFDDDGSTHSSVIEIQIEASEESVAGSFSASYLVLVLVILLGGALMVRLRKTPSMALPKWNDSAGPSRHRDSTPDAHSDATIEEDEARG